MAAKSVTNKFYGPTMDGSLSAQPLYEESSTAKHELGTRWQLPDGRVFRYAKAGATALLAGKLMQSPATPHVHATTGLAARSIYTGTTAPIGATSVTVNVGTTVTTTVCSENAFAGGLLTGMLGAGLGNTYRISGNTLMAGATSTKRTTLTLSEPLRIALTTTASKVTILPSLYNGIIVYPVGTPTGVPVGVTTMAVTAAYYFWLQTWGPVALYQGGIQASTAITVGTALIPAPNTTAIGLSTTNAAGGCVVMRNNNTTNHVANLNRPDIGIAILAASTTGGNYIPVFLRIAP